MPHIINNLEPINDEYTLDMVNCFEKIFQMAIFYSDNNYSSYYLMLIKLTQSYNLDKYDLKSLANIFNINLNIDKSENIYESIKKEIDNDNPVLVTGDLYGLYYSKNYLRKHWSHLFLIKGYDEIRKIYFIIDSCHADDYKNFVMPFETLDSLYNLYTWDEKGVYSFNTLNNKKISNVEASRYFIDIYMNYLSKQPYKEIDFINKMSGIIQKESNLFNLLDYPNKLLNTLKFKKVMLLEFIKCLLKTELLSKEIIDELKSLTQTMYDNSFLYFSKIIKGFYKREKVNNDDISRFINDNEIKIRNLITECNDIIIKNGNKKSHLQEKKEDNLIIVNDRDKIINLRSLSKAEFNFNTNKKYDFWLHVNNPLTYINKQFKPTDKFKFSVNVKITEGFKETDFQAGIFILTSDEHLFCWGSYSGITLRATHISANENLFDSTCKSLDNTLFVIIENNKCKSGYYNKEEKKDCILQEIQLTDNVKRIGFGCKTFGNGELLNINFEDFKLESL